MWTAAGMRISMQENFQQRGNAETRALYQKHSMGSSLFRNCGEKFEDESARSGTAMGRWSWMSDSWDFNHDGYPDLYIANGMISGTSRDDLNSFFWRQVVANSRNDPRPSHEYEQGWNAINELIRSDHTWSGFERNRSEEHTSELQSRLHLVCRLLLEKKKYSRKYAAAARTAGRRRRRFSASHWAAIPAACRRWGCRRA